LKTLQSEKKKSKAACISGFLHINMPDLMEKKYLGISDVFKLNQTIERRVFQMVFAYIKQGN